MALTAAARAKLPLPVHEYRYEAMLENGEVSLRAACAFLGIDCSAAMAEAASQPAADAADTWRRYGTQIAPALPALAPWIEAFGYAET